MDSYETHCVTPTEIWRIFIIFVTTRNTQRTWMRLGPYWRVSPQKMRSISVSSLVSLNAKQARQTKDMVISILHANSRGIHRWSHLPKFTTTGNRNRQQIFQDLSQLFHYMNVFPPVWKLPLSSHSLQQFMKLKCIQQDFLWDSLFLTFHLVTVI